MKIIYKKLRDNAVLPKPATELSGGMDVTAAHIEHISPNEVLVYTGLAMQPVVGGMHLNGGKHGKERTNYRIRFSPRSSFTKYNWVIQNSPCLGDADYPGEYMIRFRAIPTGGDINAPFEGWEEIELSYNVFPYKVGDRVAQLYIEEVIPVEFEEGELPNNTDRVGGFGSTDKVSNDIIKNK